MENNTSTNHATDSHSRRPTITAHLARFATATLVTAAAVGSFAATTHADGGTGVGRVGGKMHLEDVTLGAIDVADYDLWIASYGNTVEADFNGDGVVDAADYVIWRESPNASKEPHVDWINVLAVSNGIDRP